jgi:hypothetical protein
MNSGLHPLAAPFPPLQRVGLFAASSVRALAEFARLNAAARECVTQMGVRDRALPRALRADVARVAAAALRADIARGADRAVIKLAKDCDALADALVPAAQQIGVDVAKLELLIAFRDVRRLPASWTLATPLDEAEWDGVRVSALSQGAEVEIVWGLGGHVDLAALPASLTRLHLHQSYLTGPVDLTQLPASLTQLSLRSNQLTGTVDVTQLPASLTELNLSRNQLTGSVDLTQLPASLMWLFLGQNHLTGSVDLTKLPASLTRLELRYNQLTGPVNLTKLPTWLENLWLECNSRLTGVWRGNKPSGYDFSGTGITEADA